LGRQQTLDLFLDMFNITNRPNFQNPTTSAGISDRRLTNFLLLRELEDGVTRTAQFNVRYAF
jgi:hypothetical protein